MAASVTPLSAKSIARAKAAQQAERREIAERADVRFTTDGHQVPVLRCRHPGCGFGATAVREIQRINSLAAHLIYAHTPRPSGDAA